MQIASKLANFSLGEGDVLRRAMGKKDKEEMASQRKKFKEGAKKNNIDEELSMKIFDKMEKFASYGFNKSHAAAYAYLSYATAFFKANYPSEWMAALMTCDRIDVTKVAKFIREAKAMGIEILPPDINIASKEFTATKEGIRFAINAIKGIGEGIVDTIIQEREKGGPFEDIDTFFKRVDLKKVGKKNLESLSEAGCFDFVGFSRDQILKIIDQNFDSSLKDQKEKEGGVLTLFSLMDEGATKLSAPTIENPTPKLQLLLREKELLGFFLTGHPMEEFEEKIEKLKPTSFSELSNQKNLSVAKIVFIIESIKVRISQSSNRKFAILTISDGLTSIELPIWSNLYDEYSQILLENKMLCAIVRVENEDDVTKLQALWLNSLDNEELIPHTEEAFDRFKAIKMSKRKKKEEPKVEEKPKDPICLFLNAKKANLTHILQIKKCLRAFPGDVPLQLLFKEDENEIGSVSIDSTWGIEMSSTLLRSLKEIEIVDKVC